MNTRLTSRVLKPTKHHEKSLLGRMRCPATYCAQVFVIATWMIHPMEVCRAVWVPVHSSDGQIYPNGDGNGYTSPYWVAIDGEAQGNPPEPDTSRPIATPDDPETAEIDETTYGTPRWLTDFESAVQAGSLQLWPNLDTSNYWVDGQYVPLTVQGYYHSATDADNDGIPEDVDPYPADPSNNSIEWDGASLHWISGQLMMFGQDLLWHSPADGMAAFVGKVCKTDSDGDSLPDQIDPFTNDNTNDTFIFSGGIAKVTIGGVTLTRAFRSGRYQGTGICTNGQTYIYKGVQYPVSGFHSPVRQS